MDLTRVFTITDEVIKEIQKQFEYQPWDQTQTVKGTNVREILINAVTIIIANVPPCPDRSIALRKIREARMDCNSAITYNGKY